MEFKRSFRTDKTDSRCVYPKVHSWSMDGSGDCCSWDGIECDEVTGRVIALNLSSSCLSGTMSPNTTLFRLVHVESLNLAYNSFNFSPIPYGFSNLSRLQYLNLSHSDFSGEIPHDISQLSWLVSLDLSTSWGLTLHLLNMGDLVHNSTGLKEIDLSSVSLSSPVPHVLANFSSLTSLRLGNCRLNGDFPVSIFQMPNLEILDISLNPNLSGFFPKPHWGSPLKLLYLSSTDFSGEIPASIGNLSLLNELDASHCSFSGLPSSLGNLSHLTALDLRRNDLLDQIPVSELGYCGLNGDFPVSIFQLPNLEVLDISGNSNLSGILPKPHWGSPLKSINLYNTKFSGEIPSSIGNLSLLNELDASECHFSGSLPSSLGNLSHLTTLVLYGNNLQGQIPVSFADLTQLSQLILSSNNLSGDTLEWVVNLTKLTDLEISGNSFFLSAGSVGSLSFSLCATPWYHRSLEVHRRSLPPRPPPKPQPQRPRAKPETGTSSSTSMPTSQSSPPPSYPKPYPSIDDRHSSVLSKISA
ncbi:receptor-like protein 6 [Syzygium oleosum]|uniref:receptor-like protein 6 n=1 Tax=Syzygium oleosum TaxID=219896 RepID=UPI0024BAEDEC|nr:receptor-like protein 6 [Syzygium oleosum]